jgi:hypothetical protein
VSLSAWGEIGESPQSPPARGSLAESGPAAVSGRGGGARELALKVGVSNWAIGSGGANRGKLAAVRQVGGGELVMAGRRRGRGHWLVGRRGAWCRWEAQGGGDGGSP